MPANTVFDHGKHDIAPIRVERMTLRQEDGFGVVYRSSRRQIFSRIIGIEADEVGDLLALKINDLQVLAFFHFEGYTTPGGYDLSFHE